MSAVPRIYTQYYELGQIPHKEIDGGRDLNGVWRDFMNDALAIQKAHDAAVSAVADLERRLAKAHEMLGV